jgi:PAS domain S-box-containing protein
VARWFFFWTLGFLVVGAFGYFYASRENQEDALRQARSAFHRDLAFREWVARQGGVYVRPSMKTSPNPYLVDFPNRDLWTVDGAQLTLVNPAYMARQVYEIFDHRFGTYNRITSLKPVNPANAPDPWEAQALSKLEAGATEISEKVVLGGTAHMRFLGRLLTDSSCLGCHAQQGYKVGEVCGGISVIVPIQPIWPPVLTSHGGTSLGALSLLWLMGLGGILLNAHRTTRLEAERLEADSMLQTSEEKFRNLVDFTHDWEAFQNSDGSWGYVSPSCEQITGHPPSAFLADPGLLDTLIHPDDLAAWKAHMASAHAGPERDKDLGELTFRISRPDGETRWIGHVCRPVGGDGGVRGRRISNRDITERKQAEEQRRLLDARLVQAQKAESLGALAGGIAHDFNNLLAGIMSHADLAKSALPPGSGIARNLDSIVRCSEKAGGLTAQMLAYSGQGIFGRLTEASLDLSSEVAAMKGLLRASCPQTAALEFNLTHDLPKVTIDPTQMRQIILNLVVNAGEALPDGAGGIQVSTRAVECAKGDLSSPWIVEEPPPGPYLELAVEDDGSGIDPGVLPRIFDPFFSTRFTGRGLGLAAVLGIVRAHHGTLQVSSKVGQGSQFRVLLPVEAKPTG